MMIHCTEKLEKRCPDGIRRKEIRYSGIVDEVGNVKLKRIVGKSFLQKDKIQADICPAQNKDATSARPGLSA